MDKFNKLPKKNRETYFQEAASSSGIRSSIIEKDFWVCWTLKRLNELPEVAKYLIFKGGTSLSKAYGLIDRFSEDIDLTISKEAPVFAGCKDVMEENLSGKELERRIDAISSAAQRFVENDILPLLSQKIKENLDDKDWELLIDPSDPDKQTLLFNYPPIMDYGMGYGKGGYGVGKFGEGEIGYIKPTIKLEFGARGEIEPNEIKSITPYIAEKFRFLFDEPTIKVQTLRVDRTFWEKATILHSLAHGTKIRGRMARHYYDIYMMIKKGTASESVKNTDLLKKVVGNKIRMFKDNKASYETAVIGTLRLIPDAEKLKEIEKDYKSMNEMFIGDVPDFSEIIKTIQKLEQQINS